MSNTLKWDLQELIQNMKDKNFREEIILEEVEKRLAKDHSPLPEDLRDESPLPEQDELNILKKENELLREGLAHATDKYMNPERRLLYAEKYRSLANELKQTYIISKR